MAIKRFGEKIILIIITISILLSFMVTPVANAAKLDLKDGDFYYSGTAEGKYVPSQGIFAWLIDNLGMIADWIFGIISMIIRMPVIGWIALIEKLLTWSVEQTAGITNNGGLMVDSSDVTAIGDSSGNLTVQAIVYNQVPLFDINFFNLEIDTSVSPTGQKLICSKCLQPCDVCCNPGSSTLSDDRKSDTIVCNDCSCNGCDDCTMYVENCKAVEDENTKPLVLMIREGVAMWYTVIRLLSMAVMLIALLGIGLKMAISTIASEKAMYKRMLIDWVVGMIILFAMHYLIYFVIILNETLVNTVKETANSINKTQIQFVNSGRASKEEEGTQIVSDEEVEINLYEEIRTRAYDARLSIGLSGTVMYVTLIYFAIRYSIVYLKRYFTVIVLSLMAPPLGVAYALQKALTGKSSSLKTWWTEFVMTVIIQIVHALIYAIFISTALALSMESVAGMVVALIFMNFALKAEKIFRQIFKMGDGDSLAGSMAESGDAEKISSNMKNMAHTLQSAKPIAGAMMNTPMAKGIKSVGKIGLAGSVAVGNAISGAIHRNHGGESDSDGGDNSGGGSGNIPTSNTPTGGASSASSNVETGAESNGSGQHTAPRANQGSVSMQEELEEQALMAEGGDSLRSKAVLGMAVLQDPKSTPQQRAEAQKGIDNYVKYQQLMHTGNGKGDKPLDAMPTTGEIVKGHAQRAFNITNRFQVSGTNHTSGFIGGLSQSYRTVFGTRHYDAKTGKMVYDGNGYFSQFNATNLLGLSEKDKQFFKTEALKPVRGLFGLAGAFIGLGTFVAHPGIGMGAMGIGLSKANQAFRLPHGKKQYKGRYYNARLSASAAQGVQQGMISQAYASIEENQRLLDSAMVRSVRENNPDLYSSIMKDLSTEGSYSGIQLKGRIKGLGSTSGTPARYVPKKTGMFAAYGATMDAIDRYALVRAREETTQFEKTSAAVLKVAYEEEMKATVEEQYARLYDDEGLQTEAFVEEMRDPKNSSRLKAYIENCEELGFTYDQATGSVSKSSIQRDKFNGAVDDSKAAVIEETIDTVIQDMFRISGKVEDTDADVGKAIQAVEARLRTGANPVLHKKHGIEVLFKESGDVKGIVKTRIGMFNKQAELAQEQSQTTSQNNQSQQQVNIQSRPQDQGSPRSSRESLQSTISRENGFSEKEQQLIQQIVLESGIDSASATDIMDRVSTAMGMQNQGKKQPASKGKKQTRSAEREERKKKIKAIDEFLRQAGEIEAPEVSAEDVSKKAAKKVMDSDPKARKEAKSRVSSKSRDKIRTVLQFMNEETADGTLAELVDGTDEKIKRAKKTGTMQTGDRTIELSETEADVLQVLFDKMKEEMVFNQYTKKVLDQADGTETLRAKQDLHAKRAEYYAEQRSNLLLQESEEKKRRIAAEHSEYNMTTDSVNRLLSGDTTSSGIVSELSEDAFKKIVAKNKTKIMSTDEIKEFDADPSKFTNSKKDKLEEKVSKLLSDSLSTSGLKDTDRLKQSKDSMEKASRKAILSGKININKQIKDLL